MTAPINKILATNSQAFTTAQQKQARDNISAQAKLSYAYSGNTITGIDGSAVGKINTYGYSGNVITTIDGSAVGLNTASANNCISGDGSSGSPLGLSATARWTSGANWYPMTEISAGSLKISAQNYAGAQVYQNASSLCNWTPTGITVRHTAEGVGGGTADNFYGESLSLKYNAGENYLRQISSDVSGLRAWQNGNTNRIGIFGFGSAAFTEDAGTTWEVVDPASIRRWNGYSAATVSANNGITGDGSPTQPLGVSSSLTFADSLYTTLIAPNSLRMSGAAATASLNVGTLGLLNSRQEAVYLNTTAMWFKDSAHNTAEVTKAAIERWNTPPYQIKVYKPTTTSIYLGTSDYPKFPDGVDGTFVIVNLGEGPYVTYPYGGGATSTVARNQSAQLIWDSQASSWIKWNS